MVQPLLEFAEGEVMKPFMRFAFAPDDGSAPQFGATIASYVAVKWGQKGSIEDLERWTKDHHEELLAVASDPRRYTSWRDLDEDDPKKRMRKRWHALATADAWRRVSERKPVHLPCTFDAVCSGLQIYALLMRDVDLGSRVALTSQPGGEYYSEVASFCGVDRDAAKKVAMPLFYGAEPRTSATALAVLDGKQKSQRWQYKELAERLRRAAEDRARAFVRVRDWLNGAVAPAFESANQEIRWRTPLGFEVIMDNRVMKGVMVRVQTEGYPKRTTVNGEVHWTRNSQEIKLDLQEPTDKIDHEKQRRALAANVIHSLDANVLVATVNEGAKQEIKNWGTRRSRPVSSYVVLRIPVQTP
jgi:DNA-directed RNA polymerase